MHSAKAGASGPPPPDPASSLHTMPTTAPVVLGPSLPTVPGGAPPGVAALPGTSTPMASAMPWTAPSVPSKPMANSGCPYSDATLSAAHPGRKHLPSRLHRKPDLLLRLRPRLWRLLRCQAGRSPSLSSLISRLFCSCCYKAVWNRSAACVESFFRSREKIDQEGEGVLLDTGDLVCSHHCPSAYPCAEAVPMVLPLAQLRAGSRLFTRLFTLRSFPSYLTCRCAGNARPWWELEPTAVLFSVEYLLLNRLSQFANTCLPKSCPTCADLFTVEPAHGSPVGFFSSCALGLPWLPVHPAFPFGAWPAPASDAGRLYSWLYPA